MHAVHFDKAFALQLLDAMQTRKPLPAPPEGWTGHHMLTAAGVLFTAVYSQGPHKAQALGIPPVKLEELHAELHEALDDTLYRELHDAMDLLTEMTFKLIDGVYDAEFEPVVKVVVVATDDDTKHRIPVQGVKAT